MVKHSTKRLRGIRKTLQKHLFRVTGGDEELSATHGCTLWSKGLERASSLAKRQWTLFFRACSALNLIPVVIEPGTGRAEVATLCKRCIHYMLVTLYSIIMMYRTYVTFERVAQGHLDIYTYMSGCMFLLHFAAACSFLGCSWLAQGLCDVFNSCTSLENILKMETGREISVFEDKAVSIKVLLVIAIVTVVGTNSSMLSLMEIPTAVLPALTRIGLLNLPDVIPRILWAVIFLPLELLSLYPLPVYVGLCGASMVLGLGIFKVFADQVRKRPVRNTKDWKTMYRLSRVMQVYNATLMDWLKNVLSVLLFSVSCGIIVLLYVTVRPSDVHFLIYIWFPIVSAILQVIVTWLLYDGVMTKRSVTEVAENLDGWRASEGFMKLDARNKAIMTRRLKSLRPAFITVGEFSDVSFDLVVNIWDEILNQLLFLLSL